MTDQGGYYSFCNVPNGIYLLTTETDIPWGGVNSSDALLALRYFVGLTALSGLRLTAGDVNGNSLINSVDALLIAKRFTQMISAFPLGEWVFEQPVVTVSDSSSHGIDFKGLCAGDLNGSYVPNYFNCGDTLIDFRDNQKYPTVQIGTQCWMKKNLNIGIMVISDSTGDSHSNCANNGIIEKYCYNNDSANCVIYGGLYDWNEMMQYTTQEGTQGICPSGWHIPSDKDWCTMTTFLDSTVDCNLYYWIGSTAGAKLKEVGIEHWFSPNNATNESGFSALGAGLRWWGGDFDRLKRMGHFWSSNEASYEAFHIDLDYPLAGIFRSTHAKTDGFSVRCVKYCNNQPTTSLTGPDQTITGTLATLSGNTPVIGTALWSILAGEGGIIDQPGNPNSTFTGIPNIVYKLIWTISNECGSSMDTVCISFIKNCDSVERQQVLTDYYTNYLGSYTNGSGWIGGDTSTCTPGTVQADTLTKALKCINYFRRSVGLNDDVIFDTVKNKKCQQGAMMMMVNGYIAHNPPVTWDCWTQEGDDALGASNIASGYSNIAGAIAGYIRDKGPGNIEVGHRTWILYSRSKVMGVGHTYKHNALWVSGQGGNPIPANCPPFIPWPPRGCVPGPLVYERWSFGKPNADFTNTQITMTDDMGNTIPLSILSITSGMGDHTIVWEPTGINKTSPTDVSYNVKVNNVGVNGVSTDYFYKVTIIQP